MSDRVSVLDICNTMYTNIYIYIICYAILYRIVVHKQYHANELEEGELVDEPQNATGVGVEEQYTQNGWLKMAQDHKDEEFSAVNYLSTQPIGEASELEEGELVDHQEMEQLHKEEELCSYCRGLQNYCWCNWKKPTIGNILNAIDEELI